MLELCLLEENTFAIDWDKVKGTKMAMINQINFPHPEGLTNNKFTIPSPKIRG
jgi:hypothetical protein